MKIKTIFTILTCCLAISCAKKVTKNDKYYVFNSNLLKEFDKKKDISIHDVLKQLSKNNKKSNETIILGNIKISSSLFIDSDKNFVKRYNYIKKESKFYEFLPIISYFLPKYYKNREVIMVFDKNNEILNIANFYNEIKMKPKIFCNETKKSCVAKIY